MYNNEEIRILFYNKEKRNTFQDQAFEPLVNFLMNVTFFSDMKTLKIQDYYSISKLLKYKSFKKNDVIAENIDNLYIILDGNLFVNYQNLYRYSTFGNPNKKEIMYYKKKRKFYL